MKATQDRRKWVRGASTVERRNAALEAKRNVRTDDPNQEELRQCIKDNWCWWCDSGPWVNLGRHINYCAGYTAREVKDMAGMYYVEPLCSDEFSHRCKENTIKRGFIPDPPQKPCKKNLSNKFKIEARKRILANSNDEQRREANKKAAAKNRKPHECPVCGSIVPTAARRTCSDECRRKIRIITAKLSAKKRKQNNLSRKPHQDSGSE